MARAETDLLRIARVLKSNGTDGEVLVSFLGLDPEDLDLKEPVFIRFDGLPVPFFIESFATRGTKRALLRLTGVSGLKDAEELAGKDIEVHPASLPESDGEDGGLTLDDLEGWRLVDEAGAKLGTITGHEDIPGNPCLYIDTVDGQAMVPFNEDLILSVDEDSRSIAMSLPEGLL